MIEQSPARKTLAALVAMMLTVVGFQQLLSIPPAYAVAIAAPVA